MSDSSNTNKVTSPDLADTRVQMCTRLVMDTTDPEISFDANGVCNYWHEFQTFKERIPDRDTRQMMLKRMVAEIKAAGKRSEYDCVLGLSGGVDSSYLAWLAKDLGLRPLIVHFDNGWNSELAVGNIEELVTRLGYDLETFVMDWDEFRDVQRAYFKASVVDLEVPTDHMIAGALYRIADQRKIKYILSGTNYQTEWLLPSSWWYSKFDAVNLKNIHKRFGSRKLRNLPTLSVWEQAKYHLKGIRSVAPLDLIDYSKASAKKKLMHELGWRDYGGKHYESVFTRFYQGYLLPKKFDIDKRKAHLSSLILTGEISRDEALKELQQPPYDKDLQETDRAYVAKKLQFSSEEFEAILAAKPVPHTDYLTDTEQRRIYMAWVRRLSKLRNTLLRRKPVGEPGQPVTS